MAEWSWVVANAAGVKLGELTTATGKQLEFKRNQPARASCQINHEDSIAQLLAEAYAASGPPILWCYRRGDMDTQGQLKFAGHLAPGFVENAETESGVMQLVFASPFARLLGVNGRYGRWTDQAITAISQDAGDIAAELIRLYGGIHSAGATGSVFTGATANGQPVGLDIGNIEATKLRDRTYAYANVGEAIVNLTSVLDGFDFDETFQDDDGSTIALFNVYAEQGVLQPNARFEYGADTLNNARIFNRTTSPPVNYARVAGANGLEGVATDTGSIARYGRYDTHIAATSVSEQLTLDDKANDLLRPHPVKSVSFGPELGLANCPQAWDDYWIGDTVRLYARHYSFIEDQQVRVNGINVVIDDQGFEAAGIQDPTTPDDEAVLRASLSVEVV